MPKLKDAFEAGFFNAMSGEKKMTKEAGTMSSRKIKQLIKAIDESGSAIPREVKEELGESRFGIVPGSKDPEKAKRILNKRLKYSPEELQKRTSLEKNDSSGIFSTTRDEYVYKLDDDVIGKVRLKNKGDKYQVKLTETMPHSRGIGLGSNMYKQLGKQIEAETPGARFTSDSTILPSGASQSGSPHDAWSTMGDRLNAEHLNTPTTRGYQRSLSLISGDVTGGIQGGDLTPNSSVTVGARPHYEYQLRGGDALRRAQIAQESPSNDFGVMPWAIGGMGTIGTLSGLASDEEKEASMNKEAETSMTSSAVSGALGGPLLSPITSGINTAYNDGAWEGAEQAAATAMPGMAAVPLSRYVMGDEAQALSREMANGGNVRQALKPFLAKGIPYGLAVGAGTAALGNYISD